MRLLPSTGESVLGLVIATLAPSVALLLTMVQLDELPKNQELKEIDNELASVPKENIELFSKHEAEIKQYSMSGLEFIGL